VAIYKFFIRQNRTHMSRDSVLTNHSWMAAIGIEIVAGARELKADLEKQWVGVKRAIGRNSPKLNNCQS
jgi:hypothetical protein